jgi:hypothetical protein
MRMYRGDPVYSQTEITDEQREWAWEELSKTRLNTPLEGVTVKFMLEAVTRSFTHQLVRQRVGAYYVQESLRFAVKRGVARETAIPPSICSRVKRADHRCSGTTAMGHIEKNVRAADRNGHSGRGRARPTPALRDDARPVQHQPTCPVRSRRQPPLYAGTVRVACCLHGHHEGDEGLRRQSVFRTA